jgi:4-amino-4-deoxychorismate lyase
VTLRAWIDGKEIHDHDHALSIGSRGLHYGDGLFETMLLRAGRIRFLDAHLQRLREGCERLALELPSDAILHAELAHLPCDLTHAIVKLLVTRADRGRGYRPTSTATSRFMMLYPWTEAPNTLSVQWCITRLGRNPQLAGLKHLNRLEQVLAQRELSTGFDEGLMLDSEGELISATAGNVFIVNNRTLRTPDLRACGVRGVMRSQVLAAAQARNIPALECALWPADIEGAEEIFITNAVRGVRPVLQVGTRRWNAGPLTGEFSRALA